MITLDSLTNNQSIDIIKNKYGLNNGYVFNDYLPDSVVIFIDRLGKMLKDNNIPHYFESGDNIVGFRFDINRRFFCYINTDFYGDYYIHIYNKRTNENSRVLFDSQLTDKYLADILFTSFQFSDIARMIKPSLAISTKGWGYHFTELLDEYDSDPSSFNEIFKHLENKGFIYTEDDEHIYFYLKEDLNNDIKKPWFTFYKKRFFGPDYEGVYSYYDALAISYSLAPGEKELHRYARFPLANKVNHVIELIDKVMYHRHILKYLLSHSVYGNIIRCSNGYEDSFPSDFLDIQKHLGIIVDYFVN